MTTDIATALADAAMKLDGNARAIASADTLKAAAQHRSLTAAGILIRETHPDAVSAHFIATQLRQGQVVLDTITDKAGTAIWTADHRKSGYGQRADKLPPVVQVVNELLALVGDPHRYAARGEAAGLIVFLEPEVSQTVRWREHFLLPLLVLR